MAEVEDYPVFFGRVTGEAPFPFQVVMGERRHEVVAVPTGFGKTEGVVVPWLYASRLLRADVGGGGWARRP
ncbi:MAG: hypothetical protein ACRDTT_02705 [Pseudonocardiaceae bacterium]